MLEEHVVAGTRGAGSSPRRTPAAYYYADLDKNQRSPENSRRTVSLHKGKQQEYARKRTNTYDGSETCKKTDKNLFILDNSFKRHPLTPELTRRHHNYGGDIEFSSARANPNVELFKKSRDFYLETSIQKAAVDNAIKRNALTPKLSRSYPRDYRDYRDNEISELEAKEDIKSFERNRGYFCSNISKHKPFDPETTTGEEFIRVHRFGLDSWKDRNGEVTYSNAGTFPMPESRDSESIGPEKQPLLAELAGVGSVPLLELQWKQLGSERLYDAPCDSSIRRSSSWYLCCPKAATEEPATASAVTGDSSWCYRSLDPVTIPPVPSRHSPPSAILHDPGTISRVAAERDALASALASERERSEREARAHDARLAELHGVIAELVRRRDRQAARRAIPEEPDEEQDNDEELELCDSEATQPAQDDDSVDNTEHDNQKTPSLKDEELGTTQKQLVLREKSHSPTAKSEGIHKQTNRQMLCDGSGSVRGSRSYSPVDVLRFPETTVAGRCSVSVASRIRLRRTSDSHSNTNQHSQGVEVSPDISEHGDVGHLAAGDREVCGAALALANARAQRYAADCTALEAALAHATNTAQRLSLACARHESCSVGLSEALRAADRAVEAYDVLLALAETATRPHTQLSQDVKCLEVGECGGEGRRAAVCVARALLHRLERQDEGEDARLLPGRALLSPGPWQDEMSGVVPLAGAVHCEWTAEEEARLRAHVSALKARGARARCSAAPPPLHEHYATQADACTCPNEHCGGVCTLPATGALYQDMETAVLLQDVMVAREERAAAIMALQVERKRNKQCDVSPQQKLSSEVMSYCYGSATRNRNTNKDGATERRKRKSRQRKHRDHLHHAHTHAHDARAHTHMKYCQEQNVDAEDENLCPNNEHIGSTRRDVDLQTDSVTSGKQCLASNEECTDLIGDLGKCEKKYFCSEKDHADSEKDDAHSAKVFVGSLKEYNGIPKDYIGSTKQIKSEEKDKMDSRKKKNESSQIYLDSEKEYAALTKDFVVSVNNYLGSTKGHAGLPVDSNLDRDFVSRAVFYEDSSNRNSNSSSPPDVYPDSSAETFLMSPTSNNFDSSPNKDLSNDEILSPTVGDDRARFRSTSLRMKEERVTQVHGIAKKKLNLSSQNLRSAAETNL